MAGPFVVNSNPPVDGYSLGEYHKYWLPGGERNPAFDSYSGWLLAFKNPKDRDHARAINRFADRVVEYLEADPPTPASEFVIIPGHLAGGCSHGLATVVNTVIQKLPRFSYRPDSLVRTQEIQKLTSGGRRALHVHLNSMTYTDAYGSPARKIILDDVTTTGHSLEAGVTLVRQARNNAILNAIVLGKTVHD